MVVKAQPSSFHSVGKNPVRVDGVRLVTGRPSFVDDFRPAGLLHAKLLLSPHAHARIIRIDASKARALPGVHAVLTHQDVPRVPHTKAGQQYPEPSAYDTYLLDNKVRHVGDRVAAVAAETPEIAEAALELIEVEYEVLPAIIDPREAMRPGAPIIHDEPDSTGIHDASRNLAAQIHANLGDVEKGFAEAEVVVEGTYVVKPIQQSSLEPHVAMAWLDEDDRLVIRSSTQVPFHGRRIVAHVLGLPLNRIRVIKPRIGGGFGGKQEVLIEDIVGALTLATRRPVVLEYTRREEFLAARSRHSQFITMKTGVKRDGTITAHEMRVLANTGAYGSHALTVQLNTGGKNLPLYRSPNVRFTCDVVYTNRPSAGAMRGYGTTQGCFAQESHIDEVAKAIGLDPMVFRQRNHIRRGDVDLVAASIAEGEAKPRTIGSCGLPECIEAVAKSIGWAEKRTKGKPAAPGRWRRGVGMAISMQGSGIPGIDLAAATCKANEDGTFSLFYGATDLGTGGDTVLAQMAAEVLGVRPEDFAIVAADTDLTPFDSGAYASSTTYVSGMAVTMAAEQVRRELFTEAAEMLEALVEDLDAADGRIFVQGSPERNVSVAAAAQRAMYGPRARQVQGYGTFVPPESPPPFACGGAEVEVDTETGVVRVLKVANAVDLGTAIHPALARGQIHGATAQSLGYGILEEMVFDEAGRCVNADFSGYRLLAADDMPEVDAILVETYEESGAFGNKACAEVPINVIAPAVANAVAHAIGVRIADLPITAEKVLAAIEAQRAQAAGR